MLHARRRESTHWELVEVERLLILRSRALRHGNRNVAVLHTCVERSEACCHHDTILAV